MPENENNQNIDIKGNVEKAVNTDGDQNTTNQNIINVNVNTEQPVKEHKPPEITNKKFHLKAFLIFFCLIIFVAAAAYFFNKLKPPKFAIENPILRSDAALIIRAENDAAKRKEPLTVEFDGFQFSEKGIVEDKDDPSKHLWHFSLIDQNPPPEMLKDGAHRIRAGFAGEDSVDVQKIVFHTKAPVTAVQVSEAPGTSDAKEIKVKAASELQIPENKLSVEMVFFHEGEPQTINVPVRQIHDPETGVLCYEFQTKIQGLQKISDKDPRYAEPFFALKVTDQAGNSYYQEQSYAQYMAPANNRFGVNDLAGITVEKLPDADNKKEFIHLVRLIPQPKRTGQLPDGKPPIELKVTARTDNSRYLEWKSYVKDVKALTLVFRDEKQIGVSTTDSFVDNEKSDKRSADYRVEQEGKDGTRFLSNTVTADIKPASFDNSLGMKFVPIPAGTFMMGSPPDEPGRYDNETQHKVTISESFYMQTTEVTQGQWKAVMGNNPSYFKNCGDNCPVEQVSWDDIQEFIKKLNQKGEGSYRLPTEAEWEYAARAGTQTAIYTGNIKISGTNNAPSLDPIAWYGGNSGADYEGGWDSSGWEEKQYDHRRAGTHPVGKKQPNASGLYDMLGNVWEWVQDWYGNYPTDAVKDPIGSSSGSSRVLRGGGWDYFARDCRSADRDDDSSGYRNYSIGFRLVCIPKVSSPR